MSCGTWSVCVDRSSGALAEVSASVVLSAALMCVSVSGPDVDAHYLRVLRSLNVPPRRHAKSSSHDFETPVIMHP